MSSKSYPPRERDKWKMQHFLNDVFFCDTEFNTNENSN
jgi:hypothetical protein